MQQVPPVMSVGFQLVEDKNHVGHLVFPVKVWNDVAGW